MRVKQSFWWTLGALVATVVLFEVTDLDVAVQNQLFDPVTGRWLIDAQAPLPRLVFYNGIKWLLIVAGAGLILSWLASFRSPRLRPHRRQLFFLILSMGLVPLAVAGGKKVTNVFCPSDLALYGGDKPYVRLIEPMPPTVSERGCCFPAGHASGGFSLVALFFLPHRRRRKYLGLAVGLGLGWIMGLYQMAKGAHFLSHTLVTMEVAWLMVLLFYSLLYRGWGDRLGEAVAAAAGRRQ